MDSEPTRRTALVTGASAGIGMAFARVLAEHGCDLVLTARRAERLQALAGELTERHGVAVRTITADLADPTAPARIEAELAAAGVRIDVLVNNAGYGLPGTLIDNTWQQHADFIQVMVTAVTELCHRFMPGMMARGYGRIINVSSVAGLLPGTAGHTLYAAAKSFLVKMSQSLALEGARRGVHVTALCPGFTRTEFHDVTGTRDLVGQLPAWIWLDAGTVARQGYDAVVRGRPVYINGRVYRVVSLLARWLPERMFSRLASGQASRWRKA